jgi:lantibiotic modifying enzyme
MQKCAEMLQSRAEKSGGGVVWLNHEGDTTYFVSDIIGGSSGTGLFLLYAARELQDSTYRELAASVGHRLVEAARDGNDGSYWAMDAMEPDLLPMFPRLMPNFSHGTSGIAFFLATLYQETGQREFLDAALRGARYLQAVAKRESDAASIFHHEPDGKDLYYLGWCHGPVGTARLFHRLYRITGDMEWMEWVKKFARADLASGIPERQTPGFWNNVSQCCGSAGVAEFFLSLYRITNEKAYIDFARRLTENLLGRVTSDDKGMRWIQAEHRVKPELLVGQTGYMQGAAGIGMWLLHFDAFEQGKQGTITLPDSPF